MLLEQKGVGFDANFKPESKEFGISDPTGLIIILRDKLYSDKLRVFIQEYISNARDANREVGTPDHQIEITAPTKAEPIFKVRDYGPGLSPDRAENVFLNFGGTTKRATDKFIGGFGIGAKSGWAYTDSFVVRSFYQGTEYHYLCHLGHTPKGSMDTLFTGPTTEPNGVEIQVQIQQDDINRSHNLIQLLTEFWPELPKINNMRVNKPKMIVNPDLPFEMIERESFNGNHLPDLLLVLDGIPYGLQCGYLTSLLRSYQNHTRTPAFVFRAKTGEIDVAANREQVEINNKYKTWLIDKIHRTMTVFHRFHMTAATSVVSYVDFWRTLGRHAQLSRERNASSNGKMDAVDYKALQKDETARLENLYVSMMHRFPKAQKALTELKLLFPAPVPNLPPIMTKIDGFCWFFEDEQVLLVNGKLFPMSMKETEVYTRRKQPRTFDDRGRTKPRREMFQMPFKLWDGLMLDKELFHQGLPLEYFDRQGYINKDAPAPPPESKVLYNDEPKNPEKLAKLTNRIGARFQFILDVTHVPPWMETLGIKPLSKNLTPVYRAETVRIARPTGSVREVAWNESYSQIFGFSEYEEAVNFRTEDWFDNSDVILYAWTDESRNKWGDKLKPFIGRMTINEMRFIQLNKKAFKLFEEEQPDTNFIHWAEWLKTANITSDNVTQIEYEQFAYQWLSDSISKILHMLTNEINTDSIKHAEYKEFLKEIDEAKTKRGGRRGDGGVGDFFKINRKILKDLKRSRIYQLRVALLKKYPMLPIVESNLTDYDKAYRKDPSKAGILNEFLDDPKLYMRTRAKHFGDAETWLRSKE